MPKILPVGAMHFRGAREREDLAYVDKSGYIGRVLGSAAFVLVHCRPRRFGKTMNLTMLREWLHKAPQPDRGRDLFRGMAALHDEQATSNRERHAVLYLSLKGCKSPNWEANHGALNEALHQAWLQTGHAIEVAPNWFRNDLDALARGTLPANSLPMALSRMATALQTIHGAPIWLLIDEYDALIQTAWQHGFYRQAVDFLRPFLGEALKDARVVRRAVLTGILQIAKEGIFSELNGVVIDTVLDEEFAQDFGFTEAEVQALAGDDAAFMADLRRWYNGYDFAGHAIYNPWSVANTLREPHRPLKTHWMASAGTELIQRIATNSATDSATHLERLLAGESLRMQVMQGVAMPDVESWPGMLLNVMLHTGYLTGRPLPPSDTHEHRRYAEVRLPNLEVRAGTESILDNLLRRFEGVDDGGEKLLAALLRGDEEVAQASLERIILKMLSYHDLADGTPERVYHLFVLGLMARAPKGYAVRSNREYGKGRPDVVVEADNDAAPSALLEFKTAKSAKKACEAARLQIAERGYAAGLRGQPVFCWAIGFSGKAVVVKLA